MAYVAPTVDVFLERFPEFETTDEAAVQFALDEAGLQHDASWGDARRLLAVMLLAAHLLQSGASAASGKEIASESIGPFSVSYFKSDTTWQGSTQYGSRWLSLVRRQSPGIAVV
jgi:hypothetical protein